jgi:glucose-1-phosphate adenylyltransferase
MKTGDLTHGLADPADAISVIGAEPPVRRARRHRRPPGLLVREAMAMVLAGGRGSRLGPLTDWRAKPAVAFGGKFRIVDFVLSNCVNSGVRRIGVCTQYKAQSLIGHVQRGWSFLEGRFGEFVELLPAQQRIDSAWYAGTADAVYQNLDLLLRNEPRHVLVLAGDHIYKTDYERLLGAHAASGAAMTIACIEVPIEQAPNFGIVQADAKGRVLRFDEKPKHAIPVPGRPQRAYASMGNYVFDADLLYEALGEDARRHGSTRDFGRDLIPRLVAQGVHVQAHDFRDSCVNMVGDQPYWRDVGTVDAFWEANIELTRVVPDLNLYDQDWPIWTWQEQLPPAKFVFDDDERRGMAIDSLVSGGCIVSGAVVRRSLLSSNVRVDDHSLVEDSVILPHVHVGAGCVLRRVVVDKYCRIPAGLVVGVDPEADRGRFHVTEGGVTLITAPMLGQPAHRSAPGLREG